VPFAALNVLSGAVLATCKPRHRHQEFLSFLREIDRAVPEGLDVHCIVDKYSAHKHPKAKAWLERALNVLACSCNLFTLLIFEENQ
jgi:putative transposase